MASWIEVDLLFHALQSSPPAGSLPIKQHPKTKRRAPLTKFLITISIQSYSVSAVLCLLASTDHHLSFFSLPITNWQQHSNFPRSPPFLLSDELLARDQRGSGTHCARLPITPCWHTRTLGLALFQGATGLHYGGTLPRGRGQQCVCVGGCESTGWLGGWHVHFLTEDWISQLPLFVSLSICLHISFSHSPLPSCCRPAAGWSRLRRSAVRSWPSLPR